MSNTTQNKIKYAVQSANEEETNIFTEDGGVVSLYFCEDNGYVISMYYQSRPTLFDKYMWYELEEGKQYTKDWEGGSVITDEMVQDALRWLCPMADGYVQVDLDLLFSEYNKGRKAEFKWQAVLDSAKVLIEARSGRKVESINFEDGSMLRYNVVFEGMEAVLFFELKH